jgi:hypothetical protein
MLRRSTAATTKTRTRNRDITDQRGKCQTQSFCKMTVARCACMPPSTTSSLQAPQNMQLWLAFASAVDGGIGSHFPNSAQRKSLQPGNQQRNSCTHAVYAMHSSLGAGREPQHAIGATGKWTKCVRFTVATSPPRGFDAHSPPHLLHELFEVGVSSKDRSCSTSHARSTESSERQTNTLTHRRSAESASKSEAQ